MTDAAYQQGSRDPYSREIVACQHWVALVTDDWRYRMPPPKGNVDYLPITAEGRRVTSTWDPAKDTAAGEQCKAYGAGGSWK